MQIYLPKKSAVSRSEKGDPVFYHYFPLVGWVYKKRLANTIAMLGSGKYARLLEAGYGSGLLLPELKRHAEELYAIDIHDSVDSINRMLSAEGVKAELTQGSIFEMPYEDDFFDAVVSVSMLEHLRELDQAMAEIKRVLKPGAVAVLSFPVKNKITDAFYRLVGYDPTDIHPSSHRDIEESAKKFFTVEKRLVFPSMKAFDYALYMTLRCTNETCP